MKKLAGLLAFAVALAGAVVLTKYYSSPRPAPPQPAPAAAKPAAAADTQANAPVTFKPQLVMLDFPAAKSQVTLNLERDQARPAPATVWVTAYLFPAAA